MLASTGCTDKLPMPRCSQHFKGVVLSICMKASEFGGEGWLVGWLEVRLNEKAQSGSEYLGEFQVGRS